MASEQPTDPSSNPLRKSSSHLAADPRELELIDFVREAIESLRYCAVATSGQLERWFVPAFNHWYCPLVRRGFAVSMATVFDLGMHVVHGFVGLSTASAVGGPPQDGAFEKYRNFLMQLSRSPLMAEARKVWESARPDARPEVGGILVESLVRPLGVRAAKPRTRPLPEVVMLEGGRKIAVRRFGHADNLKVLDLTIPTGSASGPPPTFPVPTEGTAWIDIPDRVRLFMAHVACRSRNVEDLLDYEVVDACMSGPNLRPSLHEPPRLYRTVVETRTKSELPGQIAGITRIEIKTDQDSLLDVIPSELALLRYNEMAGLAKLLEKPLVFKRERDQDIVPKHRALVCFVVEAGSEGEPEAWGSSVRAFRHPYVYAKRQAFDLVRDLREAAHKLRNRASLAIDVAIFVLRDYHEDAVVHRQFKLDVLKPRRAGNELLDRLLQMMEFSSQVPGYFDRLSVQRRSAVSLQDEPGSHEIIDPQLDRFLQRQARRADPYHAVYLVPIGSKDRLLDFLPAAAEHYRLGATARQRVMLIEVDKGRPDPEPKLVGEPVWRIGQARSLHEAARIPFDRLLRDQTLAELRRQFVEMVLGPIKGRGAVNRRLVRLA